MHRNNGGLNPYSVYTNPNYDYSKDPLLMGHNRAN